MSEEISRHAIATDSSLLLCQLTRLLLLILPLPLRFLFFHCFCFCFFLGFRFFHWFLLIRILLLPQICRLYSSAMGSEYEGLSPKIRFFNSPEIVIIVELNPIIVHPDIPLIVPARR